jgi:hypothetical protein
VIVFLLPAFFAFTGLRTQIGLVSGARQWIFCGLIILVASVGKFGGSAIAARISGLGWRESSALGVLMNTRGLMELIVLNIGLELHVISPALFAMLVLMALITTFATTPILHFITPRVTEESERETSDALPFEDRSGVLVTISNPNTVSNVMDLALTLSPASDPPPLVLALVRGTAAGLRSGFQEARDLPPSRSPLVSAALDAAWARSRNITPRAIWTVDQANDIIRTAERARVRWLLIESRRSFLSTRRKAGIVSRVLARTASLQVRTAVLPSAEISPDAEVTCFFQPGADGRACLEFAAPFLTEAGRKLQIVLSSSSQETKLAFDFETQRLSIAKDSLRVGTLDDRDRMPDLKPGSLLIVGRDLLSRIQNAEFTRKGLLLVIQGAAETADVPVQYPLHFQITAT